MKPSQRDSAYADRGGSAGAANEANEHTCAAWGARWLKVSPSVEESADWLSLLTDTHLPISCNASQRPHDVLANDGDHNIVDSAEYISRVSLGGPFGCSLSTSAAPSPT